MIYYTLLLHLLWATHAVVRNAEVNEPDNAHQVGCFVINLVFAPIMMAVSIFTNHFFG